MYGLKMFLIKYRILLWRGLVYLNLHIYSSEKKKKETHFIHNAVHIKYLLVIVGRCSCVKF